MRERTKWYTLAAVAIGLTASVVYFRQTHNHYPVSPDISHSIPASEQDSPRDVELPQDGVIKQEAPRLEDGSLDSQAIFLEYLTKHKDNTDHTKSLSYLLRMERALDHTQDLQAPL